jgi:transcriptional regulator with XRE-family HTH domain
MFPNVRREADKALAAVLKAFREERGVTQEKLAFDTGLSASALSRIERGLNNPAWTTVWDIAAALDVGIAEIAAAVEGNHHNSDGPRR